MKVIRGLDTPELDIRASVLTVGNFDGVHRGHQQLLAQGGLIAADTGHSLTVLTFEPHPLSVVAPSRAPIPLTTLPEKLAQLAAAGAHCTVVAESEPALLGLEPEDFVRDVIAKRFSPSHIVEGPSFGFGRGRRGTVDLLRKLGRERGFEVCVVGPVELQVEPNETVLVSSSLIRDLVRAGRVHRAALCLGRPYALIGPVVPGHGRGKPLGYPTANLQVGNVAIPADGVYSGVVRLEDQTWPAAVSVGTAPTFGDNPRQIEAYLLDFDGDLYGRTVRLEFLRWLRPQEKYTSADDLAQQMDRDVADVRAHARDYEVSANNAGSTARRNA